MRGVLALALLMFLSACAARPPEPPAAPAGPFSLSDQLTRSTGVRLATLSRDPGLCRAMLWEVRERYSEVPDRRAGPYCGFSQAVEVSGTPIPYTRNAKVTCPVAAALHVWQREVVIPAARRHFGRDVVAINHYGTYSCRMRNSRRGKVPSEHATANAIDIAGFRLSDDRNVTVLNGWNGGRDERAFLREVHRGACQVFRLVLGPDADAAHANHFHFDMGEWVACQ
ncbi:MAG: extensin family protein [Alphaproteobacteria bacterium]|nr:extensin family protein [Alphaproteobacteria bacterium]